MEWIVELKEVLIWENIKSLLFPYLPLMLALILVYSVADFLGILFLVPKIKEHSKARVYTYTSMHFLAGAICAVVAIAVLS